jgi:hypothetical protein
VRIGQYGAPNGVRNLITGFSPRQLRLLSRDSYRSLNPTHAGTGGSDPDSEGRACTTEANAVFGFAGWDREVTHLERMLKSGDGATTCFYLARIRIRVHAGNRQIVREATGFGTATAKNPFEAQRQALKSAEAEATHLAFATFGKRFEHVSSDESRSETGKVRAPIRFIICDSDGKPIIENLSPEGFCTGLRQILEKATSISDANDLLRANAGAIACLRKNVPTLTTASGKHYADILESLANRKTPQSPTATNNARKEAVVAPSLLRPSKIAPGPRIDKSSLAIGVERRVRDSEHLKFVRTKPCLVCGRQPSHAHHLTFAQARGVAMKSSDEFVVPLCALHHDELHRAGAEKTWWKKMKIKPLIEAKRMWNASRKLR